MNTKRIPLALVLLLVGCSGLVLLIGSFRPLAQTAKFAQAVPTTAPQVVATATPPSTPLNIPTVRIPVRRIAQAPTKIAQAVTTPTLEPRAAEATQTSVPAQATFNAIATRARATPAAPKKANPERATNKTTNFLLVGTDTRTADPNWKPNTDVVMVLFLDTANQRASLLSLPRDLVVAIPGQQAFRINSAYHYGWEKNSVEGGVAILKQVLRDDFEIRIDHWALIDFNGLNKIIDTLGGIEVNVPCALSDTIDEQAFTIPAGQVRMDYVTAKRYVQSRYTTSDTSRNYRQQRVVWAMAQKGLTLNAPDRVPLLYDQLKDSVATDMTLLEMVGLVPAVYQLDLQNHPERLHAQVLQAPAVYAWISASGAWLYMPNYDLIQKTLDEIFDAPPVAATTASPAECPPQPTTPVPTDVASPTPTP
ncbi:MAG: LCP family protein [Chloroflexi bacterium]|nr:LCP family protein [Chloroflexota bacterium]